MGTIAKTLVGTVLVAVTTIPVSLAESPKTAPTVELAKKCRELAVKTYPPARAGTARGAAQAERTYFQQCVANRGNVQEPRSTVGRGQ